MLPRLLASLAVVILVSTAVECGSAPNNRNVITVSFTIRDFVGLCPIKNGQYQCGTAPVNTTTSRDFERANGDDRNYTLAQLGSDRVLVIWSAIIASDSLPDP